MGLNLTLAVGFLIAAAGWQRELALDQIHHRLLDALIRQPGRVFTRVELMKKALGEDALVLERTIDVHVRGLRRFGICKVSEDGVGCPPFSLSKRSTASRLTLRGRDIRIANITRSMTE